MPSQMADPRNIEDLIEDQEQQSLALIKAQHRGRLPRQSTTEVVRICSHFKIPLVLWPDVENVLLFYATATLDRASASPRQRQRQFERLAAAPRLQMEEFLLIDIPAFNQAHLDMLAETPEGTPRPDFTPDIATNPFLRNARSATMGPLLSGRSSSTRNPARLAAVARRAASNQEIKRGRPPTPWYLDDALESLRRIWLKAGHPGPRWSRKRHQGSKAEAFPSFVEDLLCHSRPDDRPHVRRTTQTKLTAWRSSAD